MDYCNQDSSTASHDMVDGETNEQELGPVKSTRNNPFLDDVIGPNSDSTMILKLPEDLIMSGESMSHGLVSEGESVFTDSCCISETDSIDRKSSIIDGEALVSSMMTSGIEVLDSSDIEIIKEERDSVESIEILDSTAFSACVQGADAGVISQKVQQGETEAAPAQIDFVENNLTRTPIPAHIETSFDPNSALDVSSSNGSQHSSLNELRASIVTLQDAGDTVTLKSNSSSPHPAAAAAEDVNNSDDGTPVSNTSDSDHSGLLSNTGYSKLQESNPSSYSPSPYQSPKHAVCVSVQNRPSPPDDVVEHSRPDTLSLPHPLQVYDRQRLMKKESYSSLSEYSSRSGSMDALIEAATSTPLHTQGTVSVDGEMLTFVAHGINELIKRSRENPAANWVNEMTPRSRSSSSVSSTTSGWSASVPSRATRSPSSVRTQSPDDCPPIDPKALFEVESRARKVAHSLDALMHDLITRLHKMSSCTYDYLDVYKDAVDKTCDAVDANIKSMYALMAKCEELSRTVRPTYQIQDQIKEIKRLLDLFETQVSDEES